MIVIVVVALPRTQRDALMLQHLKNEVVISVFLFIFFYNTVLESNCHSTTQGAELASGESKHNMHHVKLKHGYKLFCFGCLNCMLLLIHNRLFYASMLIF